MHVKYGYSRHLVKPYIALSSNDLKNFTTSGCLNLIFSVITISGAYGGSSTNATVITFYMNIPGEKSSVRSYRPIALTLCHCKLVERF